MAPACEALYHTVGQRPGSSESLERGCGSGRRNSGQPPIPQGPYRDEEGPVHSAALLVHHEQKFPLVDISCDWDDSDPVGKLRRLWTDYKPQMKAYLIPALDPSAPG